MPDGSQQHCTRRESHSILMRLSREPYAAECSLPLSVCILQNGCNTIKSSQSPSPESIWKGRDLEGCTTPTLPTPMCKASTICLSCSYKSADSAAAAFFDLLTLRRVGRLRPARSVDASSRSRSSAMSHSASLRHPAALPGSAAMRYALTLRYSGILPIPFPCVSRQIP